MHVTEAFGDLAVILDAFSRKVVGWALEAHLLAISALVMAIISRQPIPGALIHHFIRIAASNIPAPNTRKSSLRTTSSRRVGDSYDNAKVELHEKLEHEEINGNSYRNLRKPEAPSEPLSNPCITASDCIRP